MKYVICICDKELFTFMFSSIFKMAESTKK